jgi:hypothetical protein
MYHIHTSATELKESTFRFVTSREFAAGNASDPSNPGRLRAIADLSFDLLSQVQKWDKLQKLSQLTDSESAEFHSTLRLVGIMIHILKEYQYTDTEMMDALNRRYQRFVTPRHSAAA